MSLSLPFHWCLLSCCKLRSACPLLLPLPMVFAGITF